MYGKNEVGKFKTTAVTIGTPIFMYKLNRKKPTLLKVGKHLTKL